MNEWVEWVTIHHLLQFCLLESVEIWTSFADPCVDPSTSSSSSVKTEMF